MSKIIKTMLATLVLAVVIALSGSTTTYAENTDCSLTIWHFIMPDGTVVEGNPVTGAAPDPQGTAVVGATWRLYRVAAPDTWNGTDPIPAGWLTQVGTDQTTGNNGSVAFEDLAPGIYLARNTAIPAIAGGASTAAEFIVQLPMHIGGNWVCDINAFPKSASGLVIDKTNEGNRWEVIAPATTPRLVIEWQVTTHIRTGLANLGYIAPGGTEVPGTHIRFVDQLDSRIALIPTSVEVTFWNGTAYEVLPQAGNWVLTQTGNTFQVDITTAGRDIIAATGVVGRNVRLDFETVTTITDRTDLRPIVNMVDVYWGPLRGTTECDPADPQCIFVCDPRDPECLDPCPITDPRCVDFPIERLFGIEITKVNPTGGLLQGAFFHVYRASDFVSGALVNNAQPLLTFTTGANGLGSAYALPAGNFILREVTPPVGYVIIQEFMPFTIASDIASPFIHPMTVTNRATFDLPLTGGMGAIIFTAAGIVLLGGGIVLMTVIKKRKKDATE